MSYLEAIEPCCDDCEEGRDCGRGAGLGELGDYLGDYLGFNIPDDTPLDLNTFEQADGSLFGFGSVENLAPLMPVSFVNKSSGTIDASTQAAGVLAAPFTAGLSLVGASAVQAIEHMIHFGKGRKEADIITPNQNVIWQYIVNLSKPALAANDPLFLQQAVLDLQELGYNWLRFLFDPRFVDGRASAQAANTIMPYLDGTCGYVPHNSAPSIYSAGPGHDSPCMPAGCNGCANAWPGNFGYGAGLLGAIRARVVQNGGMLPAANDVTQGIGVPTLQYPATNGAINVPPQSGRLTPNGWFGFNQTIPSQVQTLPSMFDASSVGVLAVALIGGLLLLRKRG